MAPDVAQSSPTDAFLRRRDLDDRAGVQSSPVDSTAAATLAACPAASPGEIIAAVAADFFERRRIRFAPTPDTVAVDVTPPADAIVPQEVAPVESAGVASAAVAEVERPRFLSRFARLLFLFRSSRCCLMSSSRFFRQSSSRNRPIQTRRSRSCGCRSKSTIDRTAYTISRRSNSNGRTGGCSAVISSAPDSCCRWMLSRKPTTFSDDSRKHAATSIGSRSFRSLGRSDSSASSP